MTRSSGAERLPVLFIGHGNPMNAIADNTFTRRLGELGREITRPKAILCVSAHWMTEGSWVTRMPKPKTIHDFYGFPKELFDVQYPAPGSPEYADLIVSEVKDPKLYAENETWGLDHGTWSVLKHMYPKADVPVLQLSIYMEQPPEYHFLLGQQLLALRNQGVLIVGSGNIVHNLRKIDFSDDAKPFDWAIEFDEWVKERIEGGDYGSLVSSATSSEAGKLSIPTPDHWYPLLYSLGASDKQDRLRFEYEGIEHGSISMRCLSLGLA
jgi:4,5-DOPA dioxygenase extradiol